MAEIAMPELKATFKGWMTEFLAENSHPVAPAGQPAQVSAAQGDTKVEAKVDGLPVAATMVDAAQLGIGSTLDKLDNFKLYKFYVGPIASATVGLAGAILVSNIIDARFKPYLTSGGVPTMNKGTITKPNLINVGIHVGSAAAVYTFGGKFIGRTGATIMAGALLFELILKYTPFPEWLNSLSKLGAGELPFRGTTPTLGQDARWHQLPDYSARNDYMPALPAGDSHMGAMSGKDWDESIAYR